MARLTLIQGDCFRVLPTLESESVDLIIFDPPYLKPEFKPHVREKVVTSVIQPESLASIFPHLFRVLKNNSDLVLFGHVSSLLSLYESIAESGFKYKTDMVWDKLRPVNFLMAGKEPLSQHESIFVFRKGRFKFNAEGSKVFGRPYVSRPFWSRFYDMDDAVDTRVNVGFRCMTDVLYAPNKDTMKPGERTEHPTQKPLELVKTLVRAFSYEGETVLDPMLGSGTTMLACRDLKRSCVGIEIEPRYVEICKKRLGYGLENGGCGLEFVLAT
jgi:site-specific DNA-methyltransferase (adenine-specific)/modification methylase